MKLLYISTAIILSLSASMPILAEEDSDNVTCLENSPPVILKLGTLKTVLDWYSADDAQVAEAPCKSSAKTSLDPTMINDFLKKKDNTSNTTKSEIKSSNIHGVDLSDESPAMIKAFKHLTTSVDFMGETPQNQKNIQTLFTINPECKKVLCAVEKIWGTEMGPKLLYLLMKYNFNGSEFAYDYTDRFDNNELDDVILGLDDMPSFLTPLGRENQRLGHFTRGKTIMGDTNLEGNAVIMLFDPWSEKTRLGRQYTIFHELSHNLATRLNHIDESPGWLKVTGWTKTGDEWSPEKNPCFSSQYASGNPAEDFAESVSGYRYDAEYLNEKCPEKYQFIKKNVFNNLEYLDSSTCSVLENNIDTNNNPNHEVAHDSTSKPIVEVNNKVNDQGNPDHIDISKPISLDKNNNQTKVKSFNKPISDLQPNPVQTSPDKQKHRRIKKKKKKKKHLFHHFKFFS